MDHRHRLRKLTRSLNRSPPAEEQFEVSRVNSQGSIVRDAGYTPMWIGFGSPRAFRSASDESNAGHHTCATRVPHLSSYEGIRPARLVRLFVEDPAHRWSHLRRSRSGNLETQINRQIHSRWPAHYLCTGAGKLGALSIPLLTSPTPCEVAFTSNPQTKKYLWGPRIGRSPSLLCE